MTDRQSTHGHDCWGWGPKHYECAVREIERLAMRLMLRFDLSPAQKEGAIREHLIRLGWTPPDEHAQHQEPTT